MITAIINQKGGTGKTTTTVNLGAELVNRKKRVLIVDLDPQGNLSYSLGLDSEQPGLVDILERTLALPEAIQQAEGMDVVTSHIGLADLEFSLLDSENREHHVATFLEGLDYDHILIDCPPSLSLLTVNALTAADYVIIPLQMEVLSLQGLDLIASTVSKVKSNLNSDLQVLGILPVMVDGRRKLSAEIHAHVSENYDLPLFNSIIRNNVKASEAPSFGKSVIAYAPSANSAKDYKAFTTEFLTHFE